MQKKCMGWIAAAALAAGMAGVATAAEGDAYTWPGYRSDLDYDTKSNIGEIKSPTQFNNNCSGVTAKRPASGGHFIGVPIAIAALPM
jgi:hypothetical protein